MQKEIHNYDEMDISVIVVTYNQEDTIGRTLDSILSQRGNLSFEIVIGDDASTDRTSDICRSYADKYPGIIRYFQREKNIGLVRNYYQCIFDAKGNFIADCAGDDYWIDDEKLQKEFDILKADSAVSLVHTDWRCVDINGRNITTEDSFAGCKLGNKKEYALGSLTSKVLNHSPEGQIHLCTALYRKDILMEELQTHPNLFISDEYGCEDFQIEIAMAAKGKIVYIPDITLHYRVYENSVSHTRDFKSIFSRVRGNLIIAERMRTHYRISLTDLENYYKEQLDYLSAQVLYSGSEEMAMEYAELRNIWLNGVRVKIKTLVKEFIFQHKFIWKNFLKLYKSS